MEPWVTEEEIPESWAFADVDLTELVGATTEILNALSGNRYGVGRTKIRPVRLSGACGCLPDWLTADYLLSATAAAAGGIYGSGWSCGCAGDNVIRLRGGSARDLTVKLDGAVLSPSAYRLSGNLLMRAGARWPCCQRLDLDDDQPGTFSVLYSWGEAPPPSGTMAAKALARELAYAMTNNPETKLPFGLTALTRTGLTAVVADPRALLTDGLTGIPAVDHFITAVNPKGQRRRARVFSPDTIHPHKEQI